MQAFRLAVRGLSTKTPMQLISEVPPIVVNGPKAVCYGTKDNKAGPGAHPAEYLQLDRVVIGQPETCKYCGLRYVSGGDHSH